MQETHSISLVSYAVALVLHNASNLSDKERQKILSGVQSIQRPIARACITELSPRDKYGHIYKKMWFKAHTGVSELLYDHITDGCSHRIKEARNVRFEYTVDENMMRRRRPCKVDTKNRFVSFLHQMRSGKLISDASLDYNWCKASVSDDFFHVLQKFVETFYADWIHKMSDEEKDNGCYWEEYPSAYQALDGSHFHRRKSKVLPDGVRRREMFLYKHKYAEGQNVQAVVNYFGIATEVVVGIPGGTNDASASIYVCNGDRPGSTLVDC